MTQIVPAWLRKAVGAVYHQNDQKHAQVAWLRMNLISGLTPNRPSGVALPCRTGVLPAAARLAGTILRKSYNLLLNIVTLENQVLVPIAPLPHNARHPRLHKLKIAQPQAQLFLQLHQQLHQPLISQRISFRAGISRKMSAQCLFYKPTPIPTT